MGRLLQAALLVTSTVGIATAGPTRKVKVETSPIGATVYIDTIENEPACASTPCTLDLPTSSLTLIVRLDKYEPELVDVQAGRKPQTLTVKLRAAFATLTISDAPRGASVKINGEDKGKVGSGPFEVEVPAEPTTIVVTYKGKSLPLSDDTLDLNAGDAMDIRVKSGGATAVATPDGGGDDSLPDDSENPNAGDDATHEPHDDGDTTEPHPAAALRPRIVEAGLAFDVGFRHFVFSDGSAPFTNTGEVVVGPAIELWPGRALGVRVLRGLSLFARVQFSPTHQTVVKQSTDGTSAPIMATTFWGALELSLRHRWVFGSIGVEGSAGYVRDQVAFSAASSTILMAVPSADYKSLRFGARVSYVSRFEPYLGFEKRAVLSGGELANRSASADASGYHLAGGVRTTFGPISARAELGVSKYSWTFSGSTDVPSGASDRIVWLSLLAGYDY